MIFFYNAHINSGHVKNISVVFLILFCFFNCTEEITVSTESGFKNVLVIEAVITNELKHQEINITRSYLLEDELPESENNATVRLMANDGNTFLFQDMGSGIYRSAEVFQAVPNTNYTLEVVTNDGKSYSTEPVSLTQETQIDDLFVERNFNENGDEGVSILLNSFDPTDNSKYYRYEYEETYKIIAPLYSGRELIVLNNDFPYPEGFLDSFENVDEIVDFFFDLPLREEQVQICYNTVKSNKIIITDTNTIPEDRLEDYRIRFIGRDNFIISHRYSILVRQYVQSQDAYEYYKTLNEFATSESILSENQIGFLEGNITSVQNSEEKVVGFFQVSSVDSKRVYFNYNDLFQGEMLPPYFINCDDFLTPVLLKEDFAHNITDSPIIEAVTGNHIYYDVNEGGASVSPFDHRPFQLVLTPCGDCTVVGENSVPDFWVE